MRKSGILMHITSLPSPYGIGSMGKSAYEFVDFLEKAGQSYWQVLPLSPTGYGDSPYHSFCTFAGNHYLIDLERLMEQGLLKREEVESMPWGADPCRVDFGRIYDHRNKMFHIAFSRFRPNEEFEEFVKDNAEWLEDYALFMALKEKFHGTEWQKWTLILMMRLPAVLDAYRLELDEGIRYQFFLQYQFHIQWKALRRYANSKGVKIIGDVPFNVPLDSADVWANPFIFQLDASRRPRFVAGCPPDAFSTVGQLWGNPVYNWDNMKRGGYAWWIRRMKAAGRRFDVIRLDHFRAIDNYWCIPIETKNPREGKWEPGPGIDLLDALKEALPEQQYILEDLGFVTPEVRRIQKESGYPGMRVVQFGYSEMNHDFYQPHTYPHNSVAYTGTHDSMTARQWLEETDAKYVNQAVEGLGLNPQEGYVWGMIRACMESKSFLSIIQIQDYLELGGEARMNCPGTLSLGNWTWRAESGFAADDLAKKIRELTQRTGRI